MNYFFVVANEELDTEAFEQEVWKEGNLLLVKSNLPDTKERSCSSMNAELLMRIPDEVTVCCTEIAEKVLFHSTSIELRAQGLVDTV